MLYDASTEVSTDQSLTAAIITTVSTNVIDLFQQRNIGQGMPVFMQFQVTQAFTISSGTPTLVLGTVMANDAAFATNPVASRFSASFNPLDTSSPSLVASVLTLGAIFYVPIPDLSRVNTGDPTINATTGSSNYMKRYLAALYLQPAFATAAFATGKMSARLVINPSLPNGLDGIYPSAFKVS